MLCSVFEIFKIGVGPSSSHTMGPMSASVRFLDELKKQGLFEKVQRLQMTLYGSLACTGRGHATDIAILIGLLGFLPRTAPIDEIPRFIANIRKSKTLQLNSEKWIEFSEKKDLIFAEQEILAGHPNGMRFTAFDENGQELCSCVYYSIGGGFVVSEEELAQDQTGQEQHDIHLPYQFKSGKDILKIGQELGKSLVEMALENELALRSQQQINAMLDEIWQTMSQCIQRGMKQEGILPGGLGIRRRAPILLKKLQEEVNLPLPKQMDWLSLYAIAVNEENAAGGRVVTSPTNGAAGVVPATLQYYMNFCEGASPAKAREFLLVAGVIGALIKLNGSISGAEVGCQGEVGSASAMAAAGLTHVLGGSNEQIENAAEIALEHHLGMTCDPIGGLVQAPCIERNAMGAVKSVNAVSLALKGGGIHLVPLDVAIKTMMDVGRDMQSKYKETSQGGLAVNIIEC